MATRMWRPRLGSEAQRDLSDIVKWTRKRYGPKQSQLYRETILAALRELRDGPGVSGVRHRNDIAPGLHMLHVARHGNRGRHFIVFKLNPDDPDVIDVLRILHDAMDFARHLGEPKIG